MTRDCVSLIGAFRLTLSLMCIYGGGRVHYVGSTTDIFKICPLDGPLELEEKKTVTRRQITWMGEIFPVQRGFFSVSNWLMHSTPCELIFRLVPTPDDNLRNNFFFMSWVTCGHSNIQHPIAIHHLPLSARISPTYWRPPAHWDISRLLTTLFESLMPLKNMCAKIELISIYLQKHFMCSYQRFFEIDQNFQVYSFIAERSGKKQV